MISVNVAIRGKTIQSSTFNSSTAAKKAIDGNRSGMPQDGSCAQTEAETNPWWRVDLLESYRVTTVTITNREDCCAERINGAEIRIGNSLENNGNSNPRYQLIIWSHEHGFLRNVFLCFFSYLLL